eukprot:1788376-Rhodomonas_salina.1
MRTVVEEEPEHSRKQWKLWKKWGDRGGVPQTVGQREVVVQQLLRERSPRDPRVVQACIELCDNLNGESLTNLPQICKTSLSSEAIVEHNIASFSALPCPVVGVTYNNMVSCFLLNASRRAMPDADLKRGSLCIGMLSEAQEKAAHSTAIPRQGEVPSFFPLPLLPEKERDLTHISSRANLFRLAEQRSSAACARQIPQAPCSIAALSYPVPYPATPENQYKKPHSCVGCYPTWYYMLLSDDVLSCLVRYDATRSGSVCCGIVLISGTVLDYALSARSL